MNTIKNIAVICDYKLIPERVGGMDYFFWMFDKKCKQNGINVHWFFPNKSNHGDYSKLTIYADSNKTIEDYFLEIQKINDYETIITHFIQLCTSFFKKIKKNSNSKIIVIDHNPRPINGYNFKKRFVKRIKGLRYSKYIDSFVGVSKYTSNEIFSDFGNHLRQKTITIYNGVVIDKIVERTLRNIIKPTFLVASHLRKSKGIQDLIQAISLTPIEIKNEIIVDIYGEGPYKKELLELIKSYNLEKCFCFKGNKPNLNEIFCKYDYMLQPTHMECFSLSILESLAANVPVITTNVGGNQEVITNFKNGFIYKAKNVNELKNLILKIYSGENNISLNCRKLIEEYFSLEQMVDNHFKLLF